MTDPHEKDMSAQETLQKKIDVLLDILKKYGRVAVAFSGGVDSAVVAKAAALAVGEKAVAVTAVSPSLASGELSLAKKLAKQIGIRHEVMKTDEFTVEGYRRNAGDRCYYCKSELYQQIEQQRFNIDVDVICNGANLDDRGDYRPGMQAATEYAVRSPLIEAELTKTEVRAIAKYWNLEVWDKPATPCLSSRIAYGLEVTPERVRRVNEAEQFLRETFGLREFRVRHEAHDLARIEIPTESISLFVQEESRERIVNRLRGLGFRYVTLDLEGFRSGSMNQALEVVDLQTT